MTELLTVPVVHPSTSDPFSLYRTSMHGDMGSYSAGFPSYPANFSRDTFVAGILAGHPGLIASQLDISAQHQGTADDMLTGEQPGKIHHEIPGAQLPGRSGYTTYNACDTTALFLIAAEGLSLIDPDLYTKFRSKRNGSIQRATQFILGQISAADGLMWESPPPGSNRYSLRVTYWKDSILPHKTGKREPIYPVTYGLAHFITARSVLSAARILGEPALEAKADSMYRAGIETFIRPEDYTVYIDSEGDLRQASSDELHALAYIPTRYADSLPLAEICSRAEEIATPYGYMCTPPSVAKDLSDGYHGATVWVFEQALMHYGSTKFGLHEQAAPAREIAPYIGDGQELFGLKDGNLKPKGNSRQLWSVAAASYFAGNSYLRDSGWL